ncbi:DUF3918 family protein [Bacillus kexueae]|nr:DUF3918 family protein [Bacillus kexueae]
MNRAMTSIVTMGIGAAALYLVQNARSDNRTGQVMRKMGRRVMRSMS